MNLNNLLSIHAVITLAAGVLLIVAPKVIPATVGIDLRPNAYLLSYFLGAAEVAFAYLSWFARNIKEQASLRLIVCTIIIFHVVTAGVELLAMIKGSDAALWYNVALRMIITALFIKFLYFPKKG